MSRPLERADRALESALMDEDVIRIEGGDQKDRHLRSRKRRSEDRQRQVMRSAIIVPECGHNDRGVFSAPVVLQVIIPKLMRAGQPPRAPAFPESSPASSTSSDSRTSSTSTGGGCARSCRSDVDRLPRGHCSTIAHEPSRAARDDAEFLASAFGYPPPVDRSPTAPRPQLFSIRSEMSIRAPPGDRCA